MNDLFVTLRRNRTKLITVAVLVVLFLMAVSGMSTEGFGHYHFARPFGGRGDLSGRGRLFNHSGA